MAIKATDKAVKAAKIIAEKYGVDVAHVLQNEHSMRNVVLELRADGYSWDKARQAFIKAEPLTMLAVDLRVMADDASAAKIAAEYVAAALRRAGHVVDDVGAVKENYGGDGARVYLKVRL